MSLFRLLWARIPIFDKLWIGTALFLIVTISTLRAWSIYHA